ncbi:MULTISPECIES: ArsR/SmtB family transcription factor [Saccharothrix]|uniref:ArsR/SmtB family transcription factor n=1 Tax=Saccharothrix TaxID=2071 RepID=UPI001917718D|nr:MULTISPECIES: helix-turn-helix domain-containing protein [Saccharothrix]
MTSSRDLPHPSLEEIRLESVLHALADPIRMRMVRDLATTDGGMSCSAFDVPVSASTATYHFRVLRESGVIRQAYKGTAKVSWLRQDDLAKLFPGLLDSMVEASTRQSGRLGEAS